MAKELKDSSTLKDKEPKGSSNFMAKTGSNDLKKSGGKFIIIFYFAG